MIDKDVLDKTYKELLEEKIINNLAEEKKFLFDKLWMCIIEVSCPSRLMMVAMGLRIWTIGIWCKI